MFEIKNHKAPAAVFPSGTNILVSFSGGRTSALMAKLMKEMPDYNRHNLLFAYSNTGKEKEQTLAFVDRCDKEFELNLTWVEPLIHPEFGVGTTYKVVTYETASRDGEPFEAMIAKYGIPNRAFKHCSRELKFRPLAAFAENYFGGTFITALGMRFDELRRVKAHSYEYIYPMVDMEIVVEDVRNYWNRSPFDLELKDYEGNCDLCWKKSIRKKLTLLKEAPQTADWWHAMEQKYRWLQIPHRQKLVEPCHFNQKNISVAELLRLSKETDFISVTDPYYDEEESCACTAGQPLNDSDED